ncbi:hypothetical protein GCM10009127_02230 [Alteraurantiacibacter aestuarii]
MAASAATAQVAADSPRATAYQEVLQLPDWTGIWYPDWTRLFADRAAPPQLTPTAQAAFDAYQASIRENGPNQEAQAQCLPPGIPGVMQQPYPIEILFSPGRVTILTEAYEQVRRIYTDGRALPADPDLFFNGESVGYWDGDMLVVDTVGLHPLTNIAAGIPHTEKSRVHEHIYLSGPGELMIEFTITNPDVLRVPYVTRVAYRLDNEFPLREYVCAENNRLTSGEDGANIDLGFDHLEEDDPFGAPPSE